MNKIPTVPLIVSVLAIALIIGVSGWVIRGRNSIDAEPVATNTSTPAPTLEARPISRSNRTPLESAAPSPADMIAMKEANDEAVAKLVETGKQKLLARYESERVDTAWATRKQQTLERLSISPQIEQINAQPLSFNAQCRQSVCLIHAEFPSRLAADDWFTLYTLNAGGEMFNASSDRTMNPDGSARLQIYGLARQ